MKKIFIIFLIALFALTACGSYKIKGLKVGTCDELTAEMRANNPGTADDELYRAASLILFSDDRDDEAELCCDKISEESLKGACKAQ